MATERSERVSELQSCVLGCFRVVGQLLTPLVAFRPFVSPYACVTP